MFQVSDKVVCVDDRQRSGTESSFPMQQGSVYVVRGMDSDVDDEGSQGVLIVGFSTGLSVYRDGTGGEMGYAADRFRKLSEVQAENELARTVSTPLVTTKSLP